MFIPRQDRRALLLLALLTALVCSPWLGFGQAFYWGDIGRYFLPLQQFLRRELLAGRVPLWNPFMLCGTPFVGNPQMWPCYPPTALLVLLPASAFIMANAALHVFLAGAGTYAFLRHSRLKLDLWPSLTGATVYMLGGFVISKTQFPNMHQALAYVPWILLLAERLIARPTLGRAVALGVAAGLQILAAHAQISVFTFYFVLLHALSCGKSCRPWPRRLVPCAMLAGAIALGLSCAQWLPVVEATRLAGRQHLTLELADRFRLWPEMLTNFCWPNRYGSPLGGDWHAPGNIWEVACYIGLLPCLLVLAAPLAQGERKRDALRWGWIVVLSVLLSFGSLGGLYILAFYLLPGLKLFHDPARLLLGAALALAVLAALGLQELQHRWPAKTWLGAAALLLTGLDLGRYAHTLYPLKPVREIERTDAPLVARLQADSAMTHDGRVFLADPDGNRVYFLGYNDYHQRQPEWPARWRDLMVPNTNLATGLKQAGAYEPIGRRESQALEHDAIFRLPLKKPDPGYTALLSNLSVKYLFTYGPRPPLPTPGLTLFATSAWQQDGNRVRLYRNERFAPRARLYARWQETAGAVRPIGPPVPMHIAEETPDEVRIEVPTAPKPRLLMLNDTAQAGWRVFLDGQAAPLLPVAGLYRGVIIPPGRASQVVFVYAPSTFRCGLFVSCLTLAALAAFGAARWSKRPRSGPV